MKNFDVQLQLERNQLSNVKQTLDLVSKYDKLVNNYDHLYKLIFVDGITIETLRNIVTDVFPKSDIYSETPLEEMSELVDKIK